MINKLIEEDCFEYHNISVFLDYQMYKYKIFTYMYTCTLYNTKFEEQSFIPVKHTCT